MKNIIVKWIKCGGFYGKEMRVMYSDCDKFVVGCRFDFGFFGIATDLGYTIISIPCDTPEN